MEETVFPNKYKYTLHADDFVRLFLASDEADFENIKATIPGDDAEGVRLERQCIKLKETEIVGALTIRNVNSEVCKSISFVNVMMSGFGFIRSTMPLLKDNIRDGFYFQSCNIKSILISNSQIGDLYIADNSNIGGIEISKSQISDINFVSSIVGNVRLNIDTKGNEISIDESIAGDISMYNTQFNSIKIRDASTNSINLTESQIDKDFAIEFSGIGDFRSSRSSFKNFSIYYSNSGDFHVTESSIGSFLAESVDCSFSFQSSGITLCKLLACKIPLFSIGISCEIEAYVRNGWINCIDFSNIISRKEAIITFIGSKVYSIKMDGFTSHGGLYFRGTKLAVTPFQWDTQVKIKYEIEDEIKDKIKVRINKHLEDKDKKRSEEYSKCCDRLKEEFCCATFHISNSSLGKTEFTDFPFGDYRFEFRSSKISECFVSGGSLPTNNVHIVGAGFGSKEGFEQKASFYNQFKKIFEAQGDIYHATQFQARWAEEQRKLLNLIHKQEFIENPNRLPKIRILFNSTSNDRITLWLNRLSNLHGESYLRALVFIALSALAFYLIHLCAIGRLYWGGEFDPNLLGYYFEYWNPAHKINFIAGDEKISGGAVAFDFVGRVFVSYGIYQFIAAFRKHTKKQ
jgi:hypothetical protein